MFMQRSFKTVRDAMEYFRMSNPDVKDEDANECFVLWCEENGIMFAEHIDSEEDIRDVIEASEGQY